jgi:16S rRNA (adenine1518-N6/adenine1519-N6)-dimethyltransferase
MDFISALPAKKSLGQNFLTSAVVPTWLCDAAHISVGDTVLEIGPGTGILTQTLLDRGATVHALETDRRLVEHLHTHFADAIHRRQLYVHLGDARTINITSIIPPTSTYKIVANIPYYLSGFLLRQCLEAEQPPHTLVFLMQKELVERIARSKKSSLASLAVQVYGTPRYIRTVTRGHFNPMPKVDSAILAVTDISHSALPTQKDREDFFMVLHTAFRQKRKQLMHTLAPLIDKPTLQQFLEQTGISVTARPEELSIAVWIKLYNTIVKQP